MTNTECLCFQHCLFATVAYYKLQIALVDGLLISNRMYATIVAVCLKVAVTLFLRYVAALLYDE